MKNQSENENWDIVVSPNRSLFDLNLKELFSYKDLLFLIVKRDFKTQYKQTVFGPLLIFVQPLALTLTYAFIFGGIAGISTDGIPKIVFYLSGLTLWTYFADCLTKSSNTFIGNTGIFGKVYFPRLIIPVSVLLSNLIKLGAQFILFLILWLYYFFSSDFFQPHFELIYLFPLLIVIMAGLGMSFGLLISSFTIKYRDLTFFIGFGVQVLMYCSSVIVPVSTFPLHWRKLIMLNPMCSIIETFKYIFLGNGHFSWFYIFYSFTFMVIMLFTSVLIFNKFEKTFMDTV